MTLISNSIAVVKDTATNGKGKRRACRPFAICTGLAAGAITKLAEFRPGAMGATEREGFNRAFLQYASLPQGPGRSGHAICKP